MPADQSSAGGLSKLALRKAAAALRDGDPESALKWFDSVPKRDRPKALEAAIRYAIAKLAAAKGEWGRAESGLEAALQLDPQPFYQQRLERIRRRTPLIDDALWQRLRCKVNPAERLPPDRFVPVVSSVWTCGAYHSRGRGRALPWSRLLREAKDPPRDEEERTLILKVASGFLCRYIGADTPLLRHADVIVAVPPDPARYARRGMSLPDQLAAAMQSQLALLWPMEALVKTKSLELRNLSRAERRAAVQGSMAARDTQLLKDRCVLLVDDVTTSGGTLCEAAFVLRHAGAADVHAITLCHTEG